MLQRQANLKLTCVRKLKIPFVEGKFVICFLVLYLRKSFLHDSNGIRVQKRVIILINTLKAEDKFANYSLYIMKLNQFSSIRIFWESLMLKLKIKFDRGKVYYLTQPFVKFPFSRVNWKHYNLKLFLQWCVCSLWQPFSLEFQGWLVLQGVQPTGLMCPKKAHPPEKKGAFICF